MSNAFKSFVGGLAGGYITESNRQEDNERRDRAEMRQAKLDEQRNQEFDLRKRSLENQLSDQDQVRSEKTALKESQLDVTQSNEWSQSTTGKTPEEIQLMAERMSTGEDVGQAGVSVGSGTQRKSFLKDEAGLAGAKAYTEQQNNPDAKAGKWIDTLKRQGRVDEAKAFEAKWETQKTEMQQAQLDAVANVGLGFIQQENYPALVKAYNDFYKDGRTAVLEMGQGGAGSIVIYDGDPKDGKRGGVMSFKNKDEAASQFLSAVKPAEAMKQRMALEHERAKALNEREKFMWQEGIKAGFRGAPGGRTGGAGGSAAPGKPEKTGKEIALATVEDKFKSELDPSALTRVRNFVSTSYDLDPSIDNLQRVLAAEEAATSPASVTPRLMFGSQAGIAATHVNATTGAKTPLHKVSPQYIPTADDLKGFKADVASYIDAENKRQDGFGNVLLAAAQGSQTAVAEATNMLAGKIAQDLIARKPFPPGMPVAEKQKALAALQERSMALAKQNMPLVKNSISMIKTYGLK